MGDTEEDFVHWKMESLKKTFTDKETFDILQIRVTAIKKGNTEETYNLNRNQYVYGITPTQYIMKKLDTNQQIRKIKNALFEGSVIDTE